MLLGCCWFTLCRHCFAQWHEEQLAIQEGQDSFPNSECADDGGYVNNANKSCSFFLSKKCMKCMWPVAKMASFHIWPTPAAGNAKPYAGLKCLCSCLVRGILDYGRLDWTLPAVTLLNWVDSLVCLKNVAVESQWKTTCHIHIITWN